MVAASSPVQTIALNPWDVLAVCRRLVTTGEFVELAYPVFEKLNRAASRRVNDSVTPV
jgi:hypothetical protein